MRCFIREGNAVSGFGRGLFRIHDRRAWFRWISSAVAVIVLVGLLPQAAFANAVGPRWAKAQKQRSVPGAKGRVRPSLKDPGEGLALKGAPKVSWPSPGTAVAQLAQSAGGDGGSVSRLGGRFAKARAGRLPVWVGPPGTGVGKAGRTANGQAAAALPGRVRVRVLDAKTADRSRIRGLGVQLSPQVRPSGAAKVSVEVDYSGFRYAFGGDWASRLRLVRLPACAATTPDRKECQTRVPLPTRNDVKTGRLVADVDVEAPAPGQSGQTARATAATAATVTLAAEAGASGSAGSYEATSLSPSATWNVSTQTGAFSWSYPMRVPPVPGGPVPKVSLAYSSGSIDGRTVSTNNQASWVGEGFDYWPGFIERKYKQCADDGVTPKRADQCWRYDNATMSLNGSATELVRDDATGKWQPKNDDGSKVEKLTGAGNGDNNGEHWKVTTPDGTQYYFGLNRLPGWATSKPETKSTWTMPVYGNNEGEPCHDPAGFAGSMCNQAWRWNLDYVVDPHGTVSTFWYVPETNRYRRNVTTLTNGVPNGTPTEYVRGGYLNRIDYGQRSDSIFSVYAPARVSFGTSERCIPTSTFDCAVGKFTKANAAHWPDVPYDQNCNSGEDCLGNYAPSFWTRKRLSSITTQTLVSGSTYRDVDVWTLTQQMRAPGDGTAASLWLDKIQHTGKVGGSAALPEIQFGGMQKPNRVDSLEGLPPLTKWRITAIDNETGGALSISYSDPDCVAGQTPEPDSNTKRCYPQYWSPPDSGATTPKRDWFHKYVVTKVLEIDRTGGAPDVETSYQYLDGGAWHHDDDDGLSKEKYKSWSEWRGYRRVLVTTGNISEQRSQTEYLYFRGMDDDQLEGGGKRIASVTDSLGTSVPDADPLAGQLREVVRYDRPGGELVSATISDPWVKQTGKRVRSWGTVTSNLVNTDKTRTRTVKSDGRLRHALVDTDYNLDGLVTQISDLGDVDDPNDDQCVRTNYARNDAKWMVSLASRVETVSKACDATTKRPEDVVSDVRKSYDGKTWDAAPTEGDVTLTEKLGSWDADRDEPRYVKVGSATYDAYGRPLVVTDASGGKTTTAYTPATGLVTSVKETNPVGHVTNSEVEPAWGLPTATVDVNNKRTDLAYDPLGRLTGVWLPGRAKASNTTTPNLKFDYLIRKTGPAAVSTSTLRNDGTTYTTGYALYDGLLRPRQTQQPAPGGGRLVNDTIYNTRGLVAKANHDYYNESAPGTTLWNPASDDDVPGQDVTVYDGLGQATAQIFRKRGSEQWRTTTVYDGELTHVDPPKGGTPTTTVSDARGRTIELRQYKGDSPVGDAYDATRYTYAPNGQPATVTDPAGNKWTNHYDLRGRLTQVDDPDKGTAKLTYDGNTDWLLSITDARGKSLFYTYDALGRKTAQYEGTDANGTKLAEWKYDVLPDNTVVNGQPTSSTRYVKNGAGGTDAYTSALTGFDNAYRPTGTQVVIPASEGGLAGTYKTTVEYNPDGTVNRMGLPAAGGLPAETMQFGYDELGNPTTTRGLNTYVTSTSYSKLGQVLQQFRSTGSKRVMSANYYEEGTGRLTRSLLQRETAPVSIADVNYQYDEAGNITKIADIPSGQTADVQCFRQDYLQRLTEAWTAATDDCATAPTKDNAQSIIGGTAPYWQSYDHDVVGNRTREIDHDTTGDTTKDVTKTFTYAGTGNPQPHTLTSVTYQGGSRDGQTDGYAYDAAGNTTQRGAGRTLTWDVEGHLEKSVDHGNTSTFVYDASGERLIRRDESATTLYVAGMEIRLDKATGAKTATRYYSHGGQTVAARTNKGLTWFGANHQGTSDASVANDTAQTITRRRFDPFGRPRGEQPTTWPGEKGFVGGITDASMALTHLGAREYDTETGRFISVDPFFDRADPQSWNGYAYSNNNPINLSDPSGLSVCGRGGETCDPGQCPNPAWQGNNGCNGNGHGSFDSQPRTETPGPPAPSPQPSCGKWDFGCKAANTWRKHKATIVAVTVATVVTAGCTASSFGAGVVGCAVLGGAVGNMAGYYASTPADQWRLGDAVKAGVVGAVAGAAGGGLGKLAAFGLGKLATTAAGKAVTGAIGRAAGKVKNALGRGGGGGGAAADAASGAESSAAGAASSAGRAEAGGAAGAAETTVASVPVAKFRDYIFKEGATHGKDAVFRSYGYGAADSQALAGEFERQGAAKFAAGDYQLGKLDQYGQRITISIELQGQGSAAGRTAQINSGWMIRSDGSITLNTPFSGFTK